MADGCWMDETMKILIVESDKDLRLCLKAVFADRGFETVASDDGIGGLISLMLDQVDVVITELRATTIGGGAFVSEVSTLRPSVPLFITIDKSTPQDQVQNVTGIFYKPFDVQSLAVEVQRAVEAPK